MGPVVFTLAAAAAAAVAAAAVTLTFEPPVKIGSHLGLYADYAFELGSGVLFIQGSTGFTVSGDGGRTWAAATGSCASALPGGSLSGAPVRDASGALRSYGRLVNASTEGTAFASSMVTAFSRARPGGGAPPLVCTAEPADVSFSGLPRPTHCVAAKAFGCPFRLGGGALAVLRDGTLVYSAMVFWGAPDAAGIVPSSIAAFSSSDGRAWRYAGTIADTAAYPASQEGANENALAVLHDGTLVCVFRLDAGDGPATHPYVPYTTARSTDRGVTWTRGELVPSAGSARPRLLHLGADGAGGVAPAPVLLTGGRFRDAALASGGWDAKLWVNEDVALSPAAWSAPASVSFWHNALAPNASWRFSPAVNDSAAPRQCTAYTSIVPLDGGPTPGARSRRLGITYNRALDGEDDFFIMSLTVAW